MPPGADIDPPTLAQDRDRLAGQLLARRWQLACAESCTGGWLGKLLTDAPGSSAWFAGGAIAYSNAAKRRLLAVPELLLAEHGAVSEAVALAMAAGARAALDADLAVAITGVAGPDGGSAEKPVGTVWIAVNGEGGKARAGCHRFPGDRDAVRRAALVAALRALQDFLDR